MSSNNVRAGAISKLWHHFPLRSAHNWLNFLLLAIPAAIVLHIKDANPLLVFAASAAAIIPLAGILGESTQALSAHAGPTVGGLLSSTMGNATEFIIAIFALRAGHIEV